MAMKRIAVGLIITALFIIAFFQYKNYQKFNAPAYFNYKVNDSLDINYHDPLTLQQYYENAYEIGSFARELWFNKGIDIHFVDYEQEESENAVRYYKQLLATTEILEKRLLSSARLKSLGFNNEEIKSIEDLGLSPQNYIFLKETELNQHLSGLKVGDIGHDVWELQKIILAKGYKIPKDGKFGTETEAALKDIQEKWDIFPSGIVDEATLQGLINN